MGRRTGLSERRGEKCPSLWSFCALQVLLCAVIEHALTRAHRFRVICLDAGSRITFAHLVPSARNKMADSSGDNPTAVKPSVAIFSLMSGNAISLIISRLRSAMISFGVPAGTMTANHPSPTISGYPASTMLGHIGECR
jgi:hypothetical protein